MNTERLMAKIAIIQESAERRSGLFACCPSCGVALERSDLPADFPDLDRLYPENEPWINPGDSVVIAPGGEIVYGPLHQQKKHIIVEIDVACAAIAKRALDVTGHYARADIFTLEVNNTAQQSFKFTD